MKCMYTLKVNHSCGRLDFIHLAANGYRGEEDGK